MGESEQTRTRQKHSADFRELYRDDVFALLCVLSFSATMIAGTEGIAGIVLTGVLDVLALVRGIMAVYGRCRPVPRKARGVLNGLMFVVYAGTWIWLGFRSLSGAAALSGAVWTAALFFSALAVMYFALNIYDRRKRKEKAELLKEKSCLEHDLADYKNLYEQVLKEKRSLQKLRKNTGLDRTVLQSVEERLGILSKFIASHVAGNQRASAYASLAEYLDDKERFVGSTMSIFALTHPDFVAFLKASGLDDREVGYCCLYCIGLNGSEIAAYLDRKSFYNDSSLIRKKLGLGRHDMNLANFLQEKLSSLK